MPRHLIYDAGSVVFGGQCFGFKADVLQAVTVAKFAPQPVVEKQRANLDDIKTPPTPSSGSDGDRDPDLDYEQGIVTRSYAYNAVVHKSML